MDAGTVLDAITAAKLASDICDMLNKHDGAIAWTAITMILAQELAEFDDQELADEALTKAVAAAKAGIPIFQRLKHSRRE
jgi:hypothetical protein